MKLISSKKTKRRISLMFLFAFMVSNLLTLFGPTAQATPSISTSSTGTCFQHTGSVANGTLVTVYNIGTITISLLASDITPGQDTAATAGSDSAPTASATNAGRISTAGDVVGNIVSIEPPSGTNFVIVPGFQNTATGLSNHLASANASISNAFSQDSTNGVADSNLGISVGIVTAGTIGVGKAIIAIARDADSTSGTTAGLETYPKSGTSNNSVNISINGLGIAIPPTLNSTLSGTLTATLKGVPAGTPNAAGADGMATVAVNSAINGLGSGLTFNVCTVSAAAGELEAVLDTDNDSTELYDKSGTASANLLALGSIGSNTTVLAFDTGTTTTGVGGTSFVDIEPILIRGKTGTGVNTRDQVIGTAELLSDITLATHTPNNAGLDLATLFGNNSSTAPITIAFSSDNSSASTTVLAVDLIIESSTTGPASAGYSATQTSRHGFLGGLRAALFDSGNTTTNTVFSTGASLGVASIGGGQQIGSGLFAVQESKSGAGTSNLGGLGAITANASEPQYPLFVDLRLSCGSSTNPVAGWFAILNSTATAVGTTAASTQVIRATQTGNQFTLTNVTDGNSTLYTQALTNIAGSNPALATAFGLAPWSAVTGTSVTTAGNALLYATCVAMGNNNVVTILPVAGGFDAQRDIIAVSPLIQVTNISSTFSSDINLLAEISGNNLTGTTSLNLGKLVAALATSGGMSNLATAEGVGLAANAQLGVVCSSGGESSVILSGVSSTAIDTAISSACTSGAAAPASTFFVGGVGNSVSGSTVIDGSPTVQGEGRGVLVKEASATGFQELVNQVGGGATGTIFEVALPSGCDVIDDQDDNNTAVSTTANTPGNDIARVTIQSTAGVTGTVTGGGTGDAALTSALVLAPAAGSTPAKARFRVTPGAGATDNATTDAVLLRLDSQDIFCPKSLAGSTLNATVTAQNKVASPTVTVTLGTANLGTASEAASFVFADDVATSTKLEVSTNTNLGSTPRLVGGSASVVHPFKIVELSAKSIPIGGRVSARNLDPDNSVISTVVSKGQIWVIPSNSSSFSSAPAASDVTFSDTSLQLDGLPQVVTSSTVNANAPLGSLIIPIKKGTATGAADPATSTTTITVKNAQLQAAISSTTDLTASVEFFVPDAGVVVNTPGIAAGNNASTPTLFTPFSPGSTKAFTQINGAAIATASVQLGSGTLSNQLLSNRLKDLGTPQLTDFAKVVAAGSLKNADATKITVSASAVSSGGTPATDNVVTVTGIAGAVDNGAQVVVSTGSSSTYDSVTVFASGDGSFAAKLRGDCAASTSIAVNVTEQVSGTKTTTVSKTAVCGGGAGQKSVDDFVAEISAKGSGITGVLAYVSDKGGLSAVVSAGGNLLKAVIQAAKAALGLS